MRSIVAVLAGVVLWGGTVHAEDGPKAVTGDDVAMFLKGMGYAPRIVPSKVPFKFVIPFHTTITNGTVKYIADGAIEISASPDNTKVWIGCQLQRDGKPACEGMTADILLELLRQDRRIV